MEVFTAMTMKNTVFWDVTPCDVSVAFEITDVSEARSAPIIRLAGIGKLGTMLAVTSNRRTMRRNSKPLPVQL
jgi:hypothetical protein